MTEEEFRAQMEGIDGPPTAPPPPAAKPKFAGGFKQPPTPSVAPPQPYQLRQPATAPAPGGFKRPGGFTGATVPLRVRQSTKDGSFSLSGKLTFTAKVEQDAYNHVTTTGEGLSGKDSQGQWQEGWKVGELTVWPNFEKKPG